MNPFRKSIHSTSGRMRFSVAAFLAGTFTSICASVAEDIYWIESINQCTQSVIRRTTVGSGQISDVKITTGNFNQIEIDTAGGHLYWTLSSTPPDLLLRSNLDGSGETQIASVASPYRLEKFFVDRAGGKVYWIEGRGCAPCGGGLCTECPRFRRANLDGTSVETIFTFPNGTTSNHSDIAVDSAAGKMYWSDRQYAPHLSRANLDGSNMETLTTVVAPFTGVSRIALDVAGGKLYWIESQSSVPGESRIVRANLDGTNLQELVRYPKQTPTPRGLDLDATCNKFYWTLSGFCPNGADGRLIRANLDGTLVEDRSTGRLVLSDVAVPAGSSCPATTPPCGACGTGAALMTSLALLGMVAMRRRMKRRRSQATDTDDTMKRTH